MFSNLAQLISRARSQRRSRPCRQSVHLGFETLESRATPAGVSGYAFHDANNNGLIDPGESAIVNSAIQLFNASNQLIGTTATDANGFYRFDVDGTIAQTQQSLTQVLIFDDGATNQSITRILNGFNPTLGTLLRVDIRFDGHITSQIRAENLDPAATTLRGAVQGAVLLAGVGLNSRVDTNLNSQTYAAQAFDGSIDFAGASGVSFPALTAPGLNNLTVSDAAGLSRFVGAAGLPITITPQAASTATGGGNLVAQINSTGGARVTVTYVYLNSNALRAGAYKIVQPFGPAGYLNGKLSSQGIVLPTPIGTRAIAINYDGQHEVLGNNFASLLPGSLQGTAYIDTNNDGLFQVSEVGIAGVTFRLTGTTDLGTSVNVVQASDAQGAYQFTGLRPGIYKITQTAAAGFLPGRINAPGTLGGTSQANVFSSIVTNSGGTGLDYNFAWLKPASLSGILYADKNKNDVFDAGDLGLKSLTVTLTGTDDLGHAVNVSTRSNAAGLYVFEGLRPGNYVIKSSQIPTGYRRGALNIGSNGGITSTSAMTDILLGVGDFGRDYNFAFQKSGGKAGFIT